MKYVRAIIRFLLFFVASIGLYGVWYIGNFAIPNKPYWRQIIFRKWAIWFVRISGMQIEIIGDQPKPPFFLVSNHLSYVDIPALRAVVEGVFVAKGEIESWFIGGNAVRDVGNIYIDRKNPRDIPRAGARIIEKLEDGEGVILFPEGTSSKGEEVLQFNSSFFKFAAETDLPIHYASISYRIDDDEHTPSERVCWWDDTPFIVHLWRLFQLREFKAIISFGCEPVVNPDRKQLARELWQKVQEKFVPML